MKLGRCFRGFARVDAYTKIRGLDGGVGHAVCMWPCDMALVMTTDQDTGR